MRKEARVRSTREMNQKSADLGSSPLVTFIVNWTKRAATVKYS